MLNHNMKLGLSAVARISVHPYQQMLSDTVHVVVIQLAKYNI